MSQMDRLTTLLDAMPFFVKLISTLGFPILMCLYFVAKDVGWVTNPVTVYVESMSSELHGHVTHDEETITLLRLICEHTATSQYERDVCLNGPALQSSRHGIAPTP